MKKSQLRNIIRESIKEHIHPTLGNYDHHIDPNDPTATVASLYGGPPPLYGDGTHVYHYKANICPAKMAMHFFGTPNNLPLSDAGNWVWLNSQYSQAGLNLIPPVPTGTLNTQMFDCFQVHPVAESWYQPYMQPANPNGAPQLGGTPGSFADLPTIMGQYSNMQQGLADGWLYVGGIAQCNADCEQLAVDYDECNPPPGGCPDLQTPWGPVSVMWQGFPICRCVSPSVGPTNTDPILIEPDHTLTHATMSIDDSDMNCSCCKGAYAVGMTPIPYNTPGGCSSWNGMSTAGSVPLSNCQEPHLFDPDECKPEDPGLYCTCCDDNNPGMGLSPTPNIPVNTPGGCSSWDGPYAGTHLSNCQESTLWNVSDCKGHDPCDSWVDGGNCCEFCAQIGWPTNAPTNTACGGVGTGGNPNGSNNWFCECCDPESLPSKLEPTLDLEPINKMEFDPRDTERFQKLANIKRRI